MEHGCCPCPTCSLPRGQCRSAAEGSAPDGKLGAVHGAGGLYTPVRTAPLFPVDLWEGRGCASGGWPSGTSAQRRRARGPASGLFQSSSSLPTHRLPYGIPPGPSRHEPPGGPFPQKDTKGNLFNRQVMDTHCRQGALLSTQRQ